MAARTLLARIVSIAALLSMLLACSASRHPSAPAQLGDPSSADALLARIAEPGPIEFERVVAADWQVDLAGLLNLDHPRARAAGMQAGPEPIQIYLYVLRHPERGVFFVDSGLASSFREGGAPASVSAIVRAAMDTDALRPGTTTAEWLAASGERVDGVFLTHIHLDHIFGLPDLPDATPIYAGPGETTSSGFLNAFTRGTTDRLLEGKGPLREWAFAPDPSGRFDAVIDVFGDGSLFALHVPGHSPGSTAYLVRSTAGPRLLVGDASHTAWGWEHGVEPGTFSSDRPRSAKSLARLRELAAEVPAIEVHLGHQPLASGARLLGLAAETEESRP